MNEQKLRDYVCLEDRVKELEAELKQAKHERGELEQGVIDEMVMAGVPEAHIDGRVLSIKAQAFASGSTTEVAQAFMDAGMEEFAPRYCHPSRLQSFVQEIYQELRDLAIKEERIVPVEELRDALPEPLRPVLRLYLGHKLSTRVSSRKM